MLDRFKELLRIGLRLETALGFRLIVTIYRILLLVMFYLLDKKNYYFFFLCLIN